VPSTSVVGPCSNVGAVRSRGWNRGCRSSWSVAIWELLTIANTVRFGRHSLADPQLGAWRGGGRVLSRCVSTYVRGEFSEPAERIGKLHLAWRAAIKLKKLWAPDHDRDGSRARETHQAPGRKLGLRAWKRQIIVLIERFCKRLPRLGGGARGGPTTSGRAATRCNLFHSQPSPTLFLPSPQSLPPTLPSPPPQSSLTLESDRCPRQRGQPRCAKGSGTPYRLVGVFCALGSRGQPVAWPSRGATY